ncbi:MAG TPA: DUF4124 domain-containing protein [Burkholderiales bacterium]|nr:DUF4124 domain-containing protein [Burkholderiales bacterium]
MTAIKGIVALALAAGAAFAAAETVYKYERPDGKVIYSDSPVKGAKLIGRFELVPAPPAAPSAQRPTGEASRRPADGTDRRAVLEDADARIKAADQALKDAQERQQLAAEPLPGERLGNAGGSTSRLTPSYFARQRDAAAAVDAARADLDAAYRLRNEVRE